MRKVATLFVAVATMGTAMADHHHGKIGVDATGQPVLRTGSDEGTKTVRPVTAQPEPVAVAPEAQPKKSVAGEALGTIYFDTNTADLTAEAKETLGEVAEWLKTNPNARLAVEGHADKPGSEAHNLALSKRRAASVRSYLLDQGVSQARLETKGRGEVPGTERKAALVVIETN